MTDEEKKDKISSAARDVLRLSRNTLVVELRFLDSAVSRLIQKESSVICFATDGRLLLYEPLFVLKRYMADRASPVRDYLHTVLHCVYRHMFVHTLVDHALWDLSCDIAVESSVTDLGLRAAAAGREEKQARACRELREAAGMLTAEKLYSHFIGNRPSEERLEQLRELFRADDHALWYMTQAEKEEAGIEFEASDGKGRGGRSDDNDEDGDKEGSLVRALGSELDWKEVGQRIQVDMETFSRKQGTERGGMVQNLLSVNRERYDYTDFLRKFASRGEVMKTDDDEFDYIFYTYGLRLYRNMPLVEPLEYREIKRIREFVIAIDTSGSVSGRLVQSFIQKTYNVLCSTESFFSKINLHIVQCDADIQEDVKITSREEFDSYLASMKIYGLGGTDFRPVFSYVDSLAEQGEFRNLKGLIYFTDGFGTFPQKKPAYDTAFVFVDEAYNNPDVPPWAIKLVLSRDEIM